MNISEIFGRYDADLWYRNPIVIPTNPTVRRVAEREKFQNASISRNPEVQDKS